MKEQREVTREKSDTRIEENDDPQQDPHSIPNEDLDETETVIAPQQDPLIINNEDVDETETVVGHSRTPLPYSMMTWKRTRPLWTNAPSRKTPWTYLTKNTG